ncbi:MAG TPA: hypothetical protein VKD65_16815, partial [Candidatus Angelobacter sp.]|nr:hypothetical protein [Candidatus Angelobacter sp.]
LTPTFVWADDEHLLTQARNGSLVLVDVEGRRESVVTIPDADPPACGPELLRDKGNQIFYMQQDRSWLIDVAKRTFEPYLWEPAGNGFEMEYQRNDSYGHIIRYQGREIGRWWSESPATAPGYIAVAFGKVGSNLGYPEGVKVWSAENNQWTKIKPEWLTAIIGWLEE